MRQVVDVSWHFFNLPGSIPHECTGNAGKKHVLCKDIIGGMRSTNEEASMAHELRNEIRASKQCGRQCRQKGENPCKKAKNVSPYRQKNISYLRRRTQNEYDASIRKSPDCPGIRSLDALMVW